jgi:hypothetical protein
MAHSMRCWRGHWQTGYLQLLPAIRRQADFLLQSFDDETREDATAEILAHTVVAYRNLWIRGRANRAFAAPLTRFAMAAYFAGRRTGTKINSRDAYAVAANKKSSPRRISLHAPNRHCGSLVMELLDRSAQSCRWSILDQVAFRLDFGEWLTSLSVRNRDLVAHLAVGYTTLEVSDLFGVTAGRVSQLRRELEASWQEFVGDAAGG